eukprot:scaffold43089_cov50-Attheya_sp.AAC.7
MHGHVILRKVSNMTRSRGSFHRYHGKKFLLGRIMVLLSMVAFVCGASFLPVAVPQKTSSCRRTRRNRRHATITRHMNPPYPQQRQQPPRQGNDPHDDKKNLPLWQTKNRGVRITGPECRDDYEQVGWLLANEDEIMLVPGEKQKNNPWIPVSLLRAWRQSVETRRHIQVARRLAGSKYQLLLAKKTTTTPTTLAEPQRTKEVVVGVLELGVSKMNGTAADLNASGANDGTKTNQTRSRIVVTVGM